MKYDAFLSYNTKDRTAVEAIALYLKEKAGLKVFFDRWEMVPGTPVQEVLEKALADSGACVIFIGPSGLGIYQNEEARIALEKSISKKDLRVIPVLLPGGKQETKESDLPPFLRRLIWVGFDVDILDPEALRLLVAGIKNISPGPAVKAMDPPALGERQNPMYKENEIHTVTWLHLADAHLCNPWNGWESALILGKLQEDFKKLQDQHHLHPDLIFFTGDLVFGHLSNEEGKSISHQFKEAAAFLKSVRESFSPPVPLENVFLVPGNHDVNRSSINPDTYAGFDSSMKGSYQEIEKNLNKLLQNKGPRWNDFARGLKEYKDFLEENRYIHLLQDPDRLIYGVEREIRGIKIGIAGLNSVWWSHGDNEKGRLWLAGHWQVQNLLNKIRPAAPSIKIALMHHPFNWFNPAEDPAIKREIGNHFDFFLHGHEHQDWVENIDGGCTTISAGACYGDSHEETGYNLVKLEIEKGRCETWLRQYDRKGGGWVPGQVYNKTNIRGNWIIKKESLKRAASEPQKIPKRALKDRQSSMVMNDDIKIIEQIEKQIGKKLKPQIENIIKLGNNGYVLNHVGQVQGLNLDGTKVKDISILMNLSGLNHLSLQQNQITDLTPLSAFTNLTELNLSENQITELTPLSALKKLTRLELESNQITDLTPLRSLTNLRNLRLGNNNQIEDINPLTALTHLKGLVLKWNNISDISPLSVLIEITSLNLTSNKIIDLSPLIHLKSLTSLQLNNNEINDLTPLSALTQLEILEVRINKIIDITPLKELTNLKGLDASINKITKLPPDIDQWWSSMKWILENKNTKEGLNLFGNPLTDPPIEIFKQGKAAVKNYFDSSASGDRHDFLGDRQSYIVMADDIKIIEQIEKQIGKKLKRLPPENIMKLENNSYVLNNNVGQVQGLNLDGTKITDLTPLRTLTNLKNLELRNNKIEDITPLAALTHLERLILINNNISDISPLSVLIEINTLSLSTNQINKLSPLIPLTWLKSLWLADNEIDDLTPLKALTHLKTLGVRGNGVTDLTPLKGLTKLKALNASKNNITKLPPDIVRWRWWSSMEITWVDDDTNEGLNLFGNDLTDPPIEIVKQGKATVKNYFDSLEDRQSSIESGSAFKGA